MERAQTRPTLPSDPSKYPPIFIIGAPRSGSTLLYDVVTSRFRLAYISNFTAYFFRTLVLGTRIARRLGLVERAGSTFDNQYGALAGWSSPNECGHFWNQWFPPGRSVYVPAGVTSHAVLNEVRTQIRGVSSLVGAPMIFKNLFNSMRIAPLLEACPDALFIVCERDPLQNALSILRGRVERQGDKQRWWTLPPRQIEQLLPLHYARQVAAQVFFIRDQIREDSERFGQDRFFTVSYERFCADVHGTIREMERFLASHGVALDVVGEVPASFDVRRVRGLSEEDERAVGEAVSDYFGGADSDHA